MAHEVNETIAQLRALVRQFVEDRDVLDHDRQAFEDDPVKLPDYWEQLQELGVLGVHVPEELGGGGADWAHLAVVLEELGAACAPGPFLTTAVAADALVRLASESVAHATVPPLAAGESTAAIILEDTELTLTGGRLSGRAPALGHPGAAVILVLVGDDAIVIDASAATILCEPVRSADLGLDVTRMQFDGHPVDSDSVLRGGAATVRALLRLAASAHATGGARRSFEGAVEYAKTRYQFGAPIGSFQAVKHHTANMLIEREAGEACVWDAIRQADGDGADDLERAAAAAAAVALPAFIFNARTALQIYGGIGFSWEHEIHLYYRRALALAGLLEPDKASAELVEAWSADFRDGRHPSLPGEIEAQRDSIRETLTAIAATDPSLHRRGLVDAGLAMPQYDRPWGIEASPALQMLISQELARAGISAPVYGITGWCAGAIIQKGSPAQVARYAEPALMGEEIWCQLFSEPDAGSDAAAVKTKGVRTDGGWSVTGQKVWTSFAHDSRFGLATVRTDPSAGKHAGLTAMIIDMQADGVMIRPLRQITDRTDFNEVWLEDVFVPDSHVVGAPGEGWAIARSTFENERMSLGRGSTDGHSAEEELLSFLSNHPRMEAHVSRAGRFFARRHAARMINLRWQERAVSRATAGAAGNITKMLRSELLEELGRIELALLGPAAAFASPDETEFMPMYRLLDSPRASVAGGTEEIVRTQIAERIIGLPREKHLNM